MKKKLIFFTFVNILIISACNKSSQTSNQTPLKKLKKTRSVSGQSEDINFFYYDNNDNLVKVMSIWKHDSTLPVGDTNEILTITYQNNLPFLIIDSGYRNVERNRRLYKFDNQQRLVLDSILTFNQNVITDYKDTFYFLTNRKFDYPNHNTTLIETYNSPLIFKNYVWEHDTLVFQNENLLTDISTLYYQNNIYKNTTTYDYTNYPSPFYNKNLNITYIGNIKYYFNSKFLPSKINNYPYQYFFDTAGNLIKSVETINVDVRTNYYEYY